ncbi:flagellar protein FlaG [Halobacillus sp. BBL2006]|uniref:flagellar protein FlaG n=1 Tax=Halobacillus sp. BBL2006 TaxID=1543706 RepID=UPI0005441E4F|nr:flagellar protein FlaG [Halobacillus sp. BBL2006]KHE67545.1 hypothetical protein LD39_17020 [Halobacillus sp. BBL2006]
MNVRNHLTHSQLLQRNVEQLGARSTVQENGEVIEAEKQNEPIIIDKEKLKQVADSMNEFLKPAQTSIRFQFHEKLEEYFVAIVDNDTNQIVKEIPPRKMLDLYASIAESLGFIVDHKI